MSPLRLFLAAFLLFQAAGLSELLCAAGGACEQSCAAEDGHADAQDKGHAEGADPACQWHCLSCAQASLQVQAASGLLLPHSSSDQILSGPFAFVPMAPCASIFHPPA